jgi:hypothetical protein
MGMPMVATCCASSANSDYPHADVIGFSQQILFGVVLRRNASGVVDGEVLDDG